MTIHRTYPKGENIPVNAKMGRPLFLTQFNAILEFIKSNHESLSRVNRYMVPTFDLRTGAVFIVNFPDPDKTFHYADSEEDMYPRIMRWLKGEED